jgi:hypothetical protein
MRRRTSCRRGSWQGLGGVIAWMWGITGPFRFAFGSAVILELIWRELAQTHADEESLSG